MVKSFCELRRWLTTHQRRLRAGDPSPTITDIANRAGCHRDTIYALLAGDRIASHIQHALSVVIDRVEQETAQQTKTRLLNVQISAAGPKLGFGVAVRPLFAARR